MIDSVLEAAELTHNEAIKSSGLSVYEIRLKPGYSFDRKTSQIINVSGSEDSIRGNVAAPVINAHIAFVPEGYFGGAGVMIPCLAVRSIMMVMSGK
jgi:hypothetical protein